MRKAKAEHVEQASFNAIRSVARSKRFEQLTACGNEDARRHLSEHATKVERFKQNPVPGPALARAPDGRG